MAATLEMLTELSQSIEGFTAKLNEDPGAYVSVLSDLKRIKLGSRTKVNFVPPPQVSSAVEGLLEQLNVPKYKWGRYIGAPITLYDLLLELRDLPESSEKVKSFLEALDKAVASNAIRRGIFVTIITLVGLSPLIFLEGLTTIQSILLGTSTIPAVSLSYTLGTAIITLFPKLLDPFGPEDPTEESFWVRYKRNFFALSGSLIQASTYVLIIAAIATGPVVAAMFVAASFMQVLQEVSSYISHTESEDAFLSRDETAEEKLRGQQDLARYKVDHTLRQYEIMINMVAAAVLTALVAASFIPPLMFPAYVGMGLVFVAKLHFLKSNQIWAKEQLDSDFKNLEAKATLQISGEETKSPSPGFTYAPRKAKSPVSDSKLKPVDEAVVVSEKTEVMGSVESNLVQSPALKDRVKEMKKGPDGGLDNKVSP